MFSEGREESHRATLPMGVNSNRVDNFSDNETEANPQHQTVIIVESLPLPQPHREVHRVSMPPKRTTPQKLKQRLGEIFFPDDPLHRFKNQTWVRRFFLGLQYFFPIFQWAPEYGLGPFRSDLVSGITIASLAIPQVQKFIIPFPPKSKSGSLLVSQNRRIRVVGEQNSSMQCAFGLILGCVCVKTS